jgi:hypothetical protein
VISQSLNRVVHFPFDTLLLSNLFNSKLQSEQNKDFLLKIKTEGKVAQKTQ